MTALLLPSTDASAPASAAFAAEARAVVEKRAPMRRVAPAVAKLHPSDARPARAIRLIASRSRHLAEANGPAAALVPDARMKTLAAAAAALSDPAVNLAFFFSRKPTPNVANHAPHHGQPRS